MIKYLRSIEGYQTVIFHHIPKTAGVTFGRIGGRQYSRDCTFPVVGHKQAAIERFKSLSLSKKGNYRFIYGHQAGKLIDAVESPVIVTMFREPVARVLSLFYYAKRNLHHPLHSVLRRHTIETFVELSLDGRWSEFVDGQFWSIACLMNSKLFDGLPEKQSMEGLKSVLRKEVVFGLVEEFDESLLLIKETLGWRRPVYYKKVNVNPAPLETPCPQWVVEHIRNRNKRDVELYDFVKKEFARRVRSKEAEFANRLRRFRLRNRIIGPVYAYIDRVAT